MRQTCCPPCGFGIASHAGSLQVAVSPSWAQALPVVISANPSLRVWTPTPAAPRVHVPVTSPRTLAFPRETAGRRVAKSPTATSVGGNITELQSFTDVQTHKFARHTGSSHPYVLRRQAAVAFTSAPIRARYLPLQRICFASKTGQLTQGGLPPPKIGSLDGCSASRVAIHAMAKDCTAAQQLMQLMGVGETTATAIVAMVGNGREFDSGRQFAAWIGLVPGQYSSGGKARLGRITKAGDPYLRSLLVLGARAVLNAAQNKTDSLSRWAMALWQRRGYWKAVVAIAAKNARMTWAVLNKGEAFKLPA